MANPFVIPRIFICVYLPFLSDFGELSRAVAILPAFDRELAWPLATPGWEGPWLWFFDGLE